MQTTCLQPSTHYWTFTSYSWLIRLLGCKLVRAGTMFDLYIGFAFSMLVTILTQQILYEHLWDCKLPARRAARPSGLCLYGPGLIFLPCIWNALFSCFVFLFSLWAPKEQVSSWYFLCIPEPGQPSVSRISEVFGKWMTLITQLAHHFLCLFLILAEFPRCKAGQSSHWYSMCAIRSSH